MEFDICGGFVVLYARQPHIRSSASYQFKKSIRNPLNFIVSYFSGHCGVSIAMIIGSFMEPP